MDNENNENEVIEARNSVNFDMVKVFFENKKPIHISLKRAGCFIYYNGYVAEPPNEKYFFLNDIKEGPKLVFFTELNRPVAEFVEK